VVGVEPRRGVVMIVVQRDDLAIRSGDFDEGIHGGAEAARVHVRDDRLAGFSFHFENIPVPGAIRSPVDDDGQIHLLRLGRLVVGLLVEAFGERVQRERHVVGNQIPVGGGKQMAPRFGVFRGRRHRGFLEIPAAGLDSDRLAHAAAQGEDARHEGELPDGNAIHKALAAAEQRLVDGQHVLAVLGDLVIDDRVGVETKIVGVRHLPAAGVAETEHGLEPAGDAVGDVGDQLPGLDGDDQTLPLRSLKTIPVHLARRDLAVHGAGHRDAHLLFFHGTFALGKMFLAEDRQLHGLHWLAGDFGHLPHVKGQRVGDAQLADHPDLPPARFGVGLHRDLDKDQLGLGTNGRSALVFREPLLNPFDQLLLGHLLLRLGGFALRILLARFGGLRLLQLRVAFAADAGVRRIRRAAYPADQGRDRLGCGIRADGRGKLERGHPGGHRVVHRRLLLPQLV